MHHINASDPKIRIIDTARAWAAHALDAGARFDVQKKAVDSARFSLDQNAKEFCFPSKLEGTSKHQHTLDMIRDIQLERLASEETPLLPLVLTPGQVEGAPGILAVWEGALIGHVRPKHVHWLSPLLPHGVRAWITGITGGPEAGHRWYGCNIALSGIADALEAYAEEAHLVARLDEVAADIHAAGDGAPVDTLAQLAQVAEPGDALAFPSMDAEEIDRLR